MTDNQASADNGVLAIHQTILAAPGADDLLSVITVPRNEIRLGDSPLESLVPGLLGYETPAINLREWTDTLDLVLQPDLWNTFLKNASSKREKLVASNPSDQSHVVFEELDGNLEGLRRTLEMFRDKREIFTYSAIGFMLKPGAFSSESNTSRFFNDQFLTVLQSTMDLETPLRADKTAAWIRSVDLFVSLDATALDFLPQIAHYRIPYSNSPNISDITIGQILGYLDHPEKIVFLPLVYGAVEATMQMGSNSLLAIDMAATGGEITLILVAGYSVAKVIPQLLSQWVSRRGGGPPAAA